MLKLPSQHVFRSFCLVSLTQISPFVNIFAWFCKKKYDRVNLAITNNLGNVLSRGEAVSRVSDSNRTSPTTWVHSRSLSPEIIEKNPIPKVRSVFGTRACPFSVTCRRRLPNTKQSCIILYYMGNAALQNCYKRLLYVAANNRTSGCPNPSSDHHRTQAKEVLKWKLSSVYLSLF